MNDIKLILVYVWRLSHCLSVSIWKEEQHG